MNSPRCISRHRHECAAAPVARMGRLEQLRARHRRSPPDLGNPGVGRLLSDLSTSVEGEIQRHFAFEEQHIFTYLDAGGDEAIGAHLTDEHGAIRPIGLKVVELARAAAAHGFDDANWQEFRRLGQELSEPLLAHLPKEEMALLPLIEESMDAETEARLYHDYVENA